MELSNNRLGFTYLEDISLEYIVNCIQDSDFPNKLTTQIDEYINKKGNSIYDVYKGRTMLSYAAESEKLDTFKYLLHKGAMDKDTTDTWPALLETSNTYYKNAFKTYNENLDKDYETYTSLMDQIQKEIDIATAAAPEGEEPEFTEDQGIEVDALIEKSDALVESRKRSESIKKKQRELNDYIIQESDQNSARLLGTAAPYMNKTPLPVDLIGKISGYIVDDNDTRNKTIENYRENIIQNLNSGIKDLTRVRNVRKKGNKLTPNVSRKPVKSARKPVKPVKSVRRVKGGKKKSKKT